MRYLYAAIATIALLAVWGEFGTFGAVGDAIMLVLLFATPVLIVRNGRS